MIVGKLFETAALQLKHSLMDAGLLVEPFTQDDFARACREYVKKSGALKPFTQYRQPEDIEWDDERYRGDAYGAYAWAVYVAEVSVDTVTYEARVEDFVAVQEVGRVIHPVLAAGQIEGGVAQGIGGGLYESGVWQGGGMADAQMTKYIIPTPAAIPRIRGDFFEKPFPRGP